MSAYFDPLDKKNKPILEYFENKSWLIIEGSSSARASIKKTITQLGSKMSNLHDADNLPDAKIFIETKRPHFIITNKTVKNCNTLPLFEEHLLHMPNRVNAGFFVMTEENSLSEVAWALEYEMDGIISLPLNGATVIRTVLSGIKLKLEPTTYIKKIEEGRASFYSGNLDAAKEVFQTSLTLDPSPYEASSFIGQIYSKKNLVNEAIDSFEISRSQNPRYFKTLSRLGALYYQQKDYKKSYDVNLMIAQNYPTSPERIPELIRLSIINQKYDDIINYFKIFQTIQSPSAQMQNYLAAGLAILGKYFANSNDSERGVAALKDAFKFSNGKYEILKSITQSFEELKKSETLYEMFEAIDLTLWPKEVQALAFHTLHLTSTDDQKVIQAGEKLLKSNHFDPLIYRGIIERSIKIKRKIGYIENLVFEANKQFPENADELDKLLKSIS
jgi:tetratricopeptide (TPR) repeat protein